MIACLSIRTECSFPFEFSSGKYKNEEARGLFSLITPIDVDRARARFLINIRHLIAINVAASSYSQSYVL